MKSKNLLVNELLKLGIVIVCLFIIFQALFYKENFLTVLLFVISVAWSSIIPGYFIFLYWKESFSFAERIIFGSIIGLALNIILSYNLGMLNIDAKMHIYFLPILIILACLYINRKIFKEIKE